MHRPVAYEIVVLARQPNSIRQYRAHACVVGAIRRVLPFRWRDPYPEPLGGHYGVTRSLVAGLRRLGTRFAYAPRLDRATARTAIVLAGPTELSAAMNWRRRGGCNLLLAGPNVVEMPHDNNGILLSPEIDKVIVASEKVRLQYEASAPQLAGRICVWPAGVDESYWKPTAARLRDTVLIYNKRMPELARQIRAMLMQRHHRCEVIDYGEHRRHKYRPRQFRAALDRARLCIFLTFDEPQGLAAAEAWSMDVPILAFRVPGYETVATVPYLSPATGTYWSSTDELLARVADFSAARFQPRNWVLKNMTDLICAQKLIQLTDELHARSCAGTLRC